MSSEKVKSYHYLYIKRNFKSGEKNREFESLENPLLYNIKHTGEKENESEEQQNFVGRLSPSVLVEQLSRLLYCAACVHELFVSRLNRRR